MIQPATVNTVDRWRAVAGTAADTVARRRTAVGTAADTVDRRRTAAGHAANTAAGTLKAASHIFPATVRCTEAVGAVWGTLAVVKTPADSPSVAAGSALIEVNIDGFHDRTGFRLACCWMSLARANFHPC